MTPVRYWIVLIATLVGLGCLQVAQHNAMYLQGYALAEREHAVHTQRAQVSWLNAQVTELASPKHLAQVAQERRLNLVAWSTLPHSESREASLGMVRVAAIQPVQPTPANDTAD